MLFKFASLWRLATYFFRSAEKQVVNRIPCRKKSRTNSYLYLFAERIKINPFCSFTMKFNEENIYFFDDTYE